MNQVQSELRLARNLIAERDSEIQRIRTTNNQVFFQASLLWDGMWILYIFCAGPTHMEGYKTS